MANKTIKGLTVEIGGDTTKLGKALDNIEKQGRDLSSELGNINRLLKFDPNNTELLAQKQKVLAEAIGTTEEKLDKLKEAEKQVQEQFKRGEVSEEQVRALKREIIETEGKLGKYKQAMDETTKHVVRMGEESEDTAREVDSMSDEMEEAEKSADDLGDSAGGSLANGLTVAIGLATAAAAAIGGIVESTQEYRTAMGKLDTAFEESEVSGEAATETYKELQSVLGETDQAIEASSFLAKLCNTEEDLADWTTILTGVYGTFGASLPIEGLAEAANETAKTGQVTGVLADALNWAAKEGETFGVTTKENIQFTKLSEKQLKKLTKKQREEYEARKEQYEAIEDYNKGVEEATTAEDKFNIALANCTDEQERQKLITKTLTKYYGKAAATYKKTNKEVIEANKANEEWNATMAEIGAELQPAVTEVKKFGTSLLKDAKQPLKDAADFIVQKFLPAVEDIGGWVKNNGPTIKGTIAGITTAWVAYKTATIATTIAEKGLKDAIMATTVAQKALNLVHAASPWGLVATAVAGVTAAIAIYKTKTEEAEVSTGILTEEELALRDATNEAAAAFRDQKKATTETENGILTQMGQITGLANELQTLADKSGAVKEADRERANFILNELNEALGTEYQLVDGEITRYDELQRSIYEVIKAKTANSLLEANNADYLTALNEKHAALQNLTNEEKNYTAAVKDFEDYYADYYFNMKSLEDQLQYLQENGSISEQNRIKIRMAHLEGDLNKEKAILDEKKQKYDEAALNYGAYAQQVMDYEDAQQAILEGNYERAIDLLTDKGASFFEYSKDVDQATKDAVDALYQEAVDAGLAADRTRTNFENGVAGYTEEMVKESEKAYEDALNAWANAYADAEGIGEDLGDGLSGGMETKRSGLLSKARSLVSGIIAAMKEEADSNSPSKKTIALGEDMGEGGAIGLENKTDRMLKVAEDQVDGLLGVYSEAGDATGQSTFNAIRGRDTALQKSHQPATSDKLDAILEAIKAGQIIALDGDKVVGGTINRVNHQLGQLQILTERGAL